MAKGVLITFEGGEAVGKSTQIALLSKALQKLGYKIHLAREPGGTKLGEELRDMIKTKEMSHRTELLLFEASRAELCHSVIRPRLKAGEIILCDRFAESSLVYQGASRGIPEKEVTFANELATNGVKSDFIVLLNGSDAKTRLQNRKTKDRIELEKDSFHRRVAAGYLKLAKRDKRFHLYSANLDRQVIHKMILKDVLKLIKRKSV
ncbi:MAG: thymidylate kinase [Bacteriovoracaceae bacterium]|nr:thymidylate kinase [Bacteriovoracaceae bacterium]